MPGIGTGWAVMSLPTSAILCLVHKDCSEGNAPEYYLKVILYWPMVSEVDVGMAIEVDVTTRCAAEGAVWPNGI